jgi:class 3 adenylate cyclase
MKRIMYISTTTRPLRPDEVDEITRVCQQNNAKVGVTGILISAQEFFFQILEGLETDVDQVMGRIKKDHRHAGLLILKAEHEVSDRLFPDWSMKTIKLDGNSDVVIQAIRIMLENITESHRIIERYTQPAVLQFLTAGINPLTVPVQKTEKIVLFGDIAAFSYLSGLYPTEEVAEHAGSFLEIFSRAVTDNGGEVNKYIGDCVMAYFPTDRADAAIEACMTTLREIRALRATAAQCRLRNFLYCGFGLSLGPVIEGNFGSSYKMDYTLLGNTVNLASRLENFTRTVRKAITISQAAKEACQKDWDFEKVGEYQLKGQTEPQSFFSLSDELVGDTKTVEEIIETVLLAPEAHRLSCDC